MTLAPLAYGTASLEGGLPVRASIGIAVTIEAVREVHLAIVHPLVKVRVLPVVQAAAILHDAVLTSDALVQGRC